MSKTRNLRLSTAFEVPIDGDLLAIVEALYKEITLGNVLNSSFETMRAEILALIDQMTPAERRDYLAESLFLNSVHLRERDAGGLRAPAERGGVRAGRAEEDPDPEALTKAATQAREGCTPPSCPPVRPPTPPTRSLPLSNRPAPRGRPRPHRWPGRVTPQLMRRRTGATLTLKTLSQRKRGQL